ncbi:DUF4097 and DUF4098 domain-containing protein YvlB [Lactobacillus colini]|uniref:DUF4097 and DUF4098 domain-containing protein YvlB n=1 Tax=Lactobacillus colini TaxID=1819254 RepID=A0ABS4MGA4_9LACO|nr:DUF4097 family beta strand repeat-containing protein [Lactobacillus colini]MBP2058722.1 DUF4097 and DUF4098 domain-containing protein YvlB [Lactobacillus colini]
MSISKKLALSASLLVLAGGTTALFQNIQTSNEEARQSNNSELLSKTINEISITNNNDNIRIKIGSKPAVNYDGPQKLAPVVKVRNGKLDISSPRRFTFNFFSKNVHNLTITLPAKKLKNVVINTSNGNVNVDKLNTEKGSIATSNGNVTISDLKSQFGFELSSSNGNITVEHSNASGYDFSNSNGTNRFKKLKVADDFSKIESRTNVLEISNSNGNIQVL